MADVDTELDIERRAPPDNVALEARAVAAQQKAARVKIEPDGSGGWRVIVDGARQNVGGPPVDIPPEQWNGNDNGNNGNSNNPASGHKPMKNAELDSFFAEIRGRTENRKQITETEQRSDAPAYWRATINYDDKSFDQ